MGTKQEPGAYDCYAKAQPTEPLFTLVAHDRAAPDTIRCWVALRLDVTMPIDGDWTHLKQSIRQIAEASPDAIQLCEALDCADAMERWRIDRKGKADVEGAGG